MSKKQLNISKMIDGDKANQRKRKLANDDDANNSSNEDHNYLDNSELRNYSTFQSKIRKRTSIFGKDISRTSTFIANASDNTERTNKPPEPGPSSPLSQKPRFNPTILNSPFYPGPTTYGGASACRLSFMTSAEAKARSYLDQGAGPSSKFDNKPEQINVKSSTCQDNSMSQTARRIFNLLEQYSSPPKIARRSACLDNTLSPYSRTPPSYLFDKSKRNSSHVSLLTPEVKRKQGISSLPELSILTIPDLIMMRHKRKLMDDTTESARQIASSHSNALSDSPHSYSIRNEGIKRHEKSTGVIRTRVSRKNESRINLEEPITQVNLPNAILPIQGGNLPTFHLPKIASAPKTSQKKEATDVTRKQCFEFAKPLTVTDIKKNIAAKNNFTFSRPLSAASKPDKRNDSVKANSKPSVNFKYDPLKTADTRPSLKDSSKSASGDSSVPLSRIASDFNPTGNWICVECWVPNKHSESKCVACGTSRSDGIKPISNPSVNFNYEPPKNVNARPSIKDSSKSVSGESKTASNWTCAECWVSNKHSESKCVACGNSKIIEDSTVGVGTIADYFKSANKHAEGDNEVNSSADKLKNTEVKKIPNSVVAKKPNENSFKTLSANQFIKPGSWMCKTCSVFNKSEDDKCVACTATKPRVNFEPALNTHNVASNPSKLNSYDLLQQSEKPHLLANQFNAAGSWSCKECWVSNKGEELKCVACGTSKPPGKNISQFEKASLADKSENAIESDKTDSFSPLLACQFNKTDNWSCKDCWVSNKQVDLKCVACGSCKPVATKTPEKSPSCNELKVESKNKSSNWECKDCFVKNKNDAIKCIACGGVRYEVKTDNLLKKPANYANADNTFKDLINQQSAMWKCPDCMTRNETTKVKCVCCNGLKPGAQKSTSESNFTFSSPQTATFKFGIDKANTDSLGTNSISSPSNVLAKPSENPSGGFKFGIPSSTSGSFTFGIPKDGNLKIVNSIPKVNSDDKPSGDKPVGGFVFGVPQTTNVMQSKPEEDKATTKSVPSFIAPQPKELTNEIIVPAEDKTELKKSNPNEVKLPLFNSTPTPAVAGISQAVKSNEAPSKQTFIFGSSGAEKSNVDDTNKTAKGITENASLQSTTSSKTLPSFTFGSANALSTFKSPETKTFTFGSSTATDASNTSATQPKLLNAFSPENKAVAPFTFGGGIVNLTEPVKASGFNIESTVPKKTEMNISFNFAPANNSISTPSTDVKIGLQGNAAKTEASPFSVPLSAQSASSPFASTLPSVFPNKGANLFNATTKPSQSEGLFKQSADVAGGITGGLFNPPVQQPALGASPIFGATSQVALPGTQSQSIFGMSSGASQPPTVGFGSSVTAGTHLGGGMFGSASQTPGAAHEQRTNVFQPATGSLFGSPQSNPPALPSANTSIFGSSPAAAGSATFGAPSNLFGQPSQPAAQLNAGFNFGAATSVPSVFNFGQSTNPPSQNTTFQFGTSSNAAPAFNAEIQPQFNFNLGASPAASRSTQPNNTLAARKVRRAMRRMTPRWTQGPRGELM